MKILKKNLYLPFFAFFLSVLLFSCEKAQSDNEEAPLSINEIIDQINSDDNLYAKMEKIYEMEISKAGENLSSLYLDTMDKYKNRTELELNAIGNAFYGLYDDIIVSNGNDQRKKIVDPNCFTGKHGCCNVYPVGIVPRCFRFYCPDFLHTVLCL
ncbi:hypothetical protein [Aquimarina sp. RZ0]|uniref:hypothetical protein n=1 Tax=Aquimarina sp. RZ0 TaxID=2607730 RepID=UPI0011F381DC|nr:hypothetical protein [Aquimarina sp. RZ0]KAA1246269.1 hypothetical protein F0000_08210 [Aquimarina sp. RZ0]